MRQAGEVTFADAHRPKLNEGVVEFASYGDLKNAIEKLSGKEINGRKIKLIEGSKRHRSRSTDLKPRSSSGTKPTRRAPSETIAPTTHRLKSCKIRLRMLKYKMPSASCELTMLSWLQRTSD